MKRVGHGGSAIMAQVTNKALNVYATFFRWNIKHMNPPPPPQQQQKSENIVLAGIVSLQPHKAHEKQNNNGHFYGALSLANSKAQSTIQKWF